MARLQALQEFSNLGSGYSLAFRDLQIRGAGELLGAKQSGTMLTVGYELYTQLIQEAVAQLKNGVDGVNLDGDGVADPLASLEPLPTFDLPVVALLPDTYIRDQAQRLYYYQRLMSCRDLVSLGAVQAEVEDRYGRPPTPVRAAFRVMELRLRARDLDITRLDGKSQRLAITFGDKDAIPPRVISLLVKQNRDATTTRTEVIWPYRTDPLVAIDDFFTKFIQAQEQVQAARATYA
jgi:transcription-repair coupling factor (superfamily II helicase)